jgi:uncharacterized RDD family membrane protein YckC
MAPERLLRSLTPSPSPSPRDHGEYEFRLAMEREADRSLMGLDFRIAPPSPPGKGVGGLGPPPPTTTADTVGAARIATPEQVTIILPLAGVGTRILAALLDALIIVATILFVFVVIALVGSIIAAQAHGLAAGSVLGAFTLLFLFGFIFAYYAGLELLWDGQTVGKRALKLRVLRDNGTPVDAASVLARTVVRLVDFLPVGYLVGLISMVVDGRARRLGDIVGGTIVVREADNAPTLREIAVAAEPAAWGPPPPGQEAPIHLLTTDEVAAAREFLRRAVTFPPRERAALAWRIATTLALRIGYPGPITDPEWFLIWIARSAAGVNV